ncbi:copper resistance protein CopZ [Cohnella sp. CIP 111063]|jgi:copper chaperone|uniref:cation transporter n=1 Tax=unclassified Cohnella TaxID=2636738 RepID=UPI000B8C081B|nr:MULTISPECIES: cation transporter [unclassified Cohnella]OXS61117.1 copper resistance protein CopZ [Cohnella sp. CIP 111063]PRX73669.1 copper chaperone [Cohnella sp. SGD-V74]
MAKTILKVEGMSCQHCVNSVEGALKEIGAEGTVDLKSGSVEVTYNEASTTVDKIKAAIEDQGYDVKS